VTIALAWATRSATLEPPAVASITSATPVQLITTRERFSIDAKQCEQRCPTRSRLFVHRNPGENVEDMIDLNGRLYRSLPSAFCTERSSWQTAPAAVTHGTRRHWRGIALTQTRPD